MPEFIFDVQGLQTAFKTPAGAVDAVNGLSPRLAGCKSFNILSDRGKRGLTTNTTGIQKTYSMFSIQQPGTAWLESA